MELKSFKIFLFEAITGRKNIQTKLAMSDSDYLEFASAWDSNAIKHAGIDIFKLSPEEALDLLKKHREAKAAKVAKTTTQEENAPIVVHSEKYIIRHIKDSSASRKYATCKDSKTGYTEWCIAYNDDAVRDNHYKHYSFDNKNNVFYFIPNSGHDPFAILIDKNGTINSIWNWKDAEQTSKKRVSIIITELEMQYGNDVFESIEKIKKIRFYSNPKYEAQIWKNLKELEDKFAETKDPNLVLENDKNIFSSAFLSIFNFTNDSPSYKKILDFLKKLLDAGADINTHASGYNTPLNLAFKFGDLVMINFLLSRGADINKNVSFSYMNAVESNNMDVVKFLISKLDINSIKDVNSKDSIFSSALHTKNYDIVKLLLDSGLSVRDSFNYHKIGDALSDPNMVDLILTHKNGLNPNNTSKFEERTLLMVAAGEADKYILDVLKALIKYGADANAKDHYGKTALDRAKGALHPNPEVIKYLESVMSPEARQEKRGFVDEDVVEDDTNGN
jgi:ankyrin repeat protein